MLNVEPIVEQEVLNVINSHIQMPKVLLKRFHNDNSRFFYYDVQKHVIGNNGRAKSINTQLGYYSQQTEDCFRDNIETPFGEVLTYIEKTGIDRETFTISSSAKEIIKKLHVCFDFQRPIVQRSNE